MNSFIRGNDYGKGIAEQKGVIVPNCRYLFTSTQSKAGYYCRNAGDCEYIDKEVNCPIVEFARERYNLLTGKVKEGKYYEFVQTGMTKEDSIPTYSLILKSTKAKIVETKKEDKDPLERLLER
jgi:hypothetical protein